MLAQIIAVVIFLAMFVFIVMDKIERQIVTLVCGLLMMVLVFGLCMHSLPAIWGDPECKEHLQRPLLVSIRQRR